MSKRLTMTQAIALVALCSVSTSSLLAITTKKASRKSYTRELEEAFAAKILQEKGEPISVFKSSKDGAAGHKEVGGSVVTDIKTMLKNPFLDLLASSDLAGWTDVKGRFEAVKRAIELFEVKYSIELKGSASTPAATPTSMGMSSSDMGVSATPAPIGSSSTTPPVIAATPGSTPMGMNGMGMSAAPVPSSAPSVTPPPALPAPAPMGMGDMGMPSAVPATPPASSPMGAPSVTPPPVLPAPAPMGMPSATPSTPAVPSPMGAPGVTPPPVLPAPAPMGMPSATPAPMGMPMA